MSNPPSTLVATYFLLGDTNPQLQSSDVQTQIDFGEVPSPVLSVPLVVGDKTYTVNVMNTKDSLGKSIASILHMGCYGETEVGHWVIKDYMLTVPSIKELRSMTPDEFWHSIVHYNDPKAFDPSDLSKFAYTYFGTIYKYDGELIIKIYKELTYKDIQLAESYEVDTTTASDKLSKAMAMGNEVATVKSSGSLTTGTNNNRDVYNLNSTNTLSGANKPQKTSTILCNIYGSTFTGLAFNKTDATTKISTILDIEDGSEEEEYLKKGKLNDSSTSPLLKVSLISQSNPENTIMTLTPILAKRIKPRKYKKVSSNTYRQKTQHKDALVELGCGAIGSGKSCGTYTGNTSTLDPVLDSVADQKVSKSVFGNVKSNLVPKQTTTVVLSMTKNKERGLDSGPGLWALLEDRVTAVSLAGSSISPVVASLLNKNIRRLSGYLEQKQLSPLILQLDNYEAVE